MSVTNEIPSSHPSSASAPENWWSDPSVQLYGSHAPTEVSSEQTTGEGREERIEAILQKVHELDVHGSATIPMAEDRLSAQTASAERELSFAEIAALGKGHKLHISFDTADEARRGKVTSLLDTLVQRGGVTAYKLGQNSGQEGKDATIYVGHKDKAQLIADLLGQELADVLDEPSGDVLDSDVQYAPKIMGRFEVQGLDPEFHQYGAEGFPLLNNDVGRYSMMRLEGTSAEALATFLEQAKARAQTTLRSRYGAFYTGAAAE